MGSKKIFSNALNIKINGYYIQNLFQLKQTCSPYLALYIEWKRVTNIVERTITLEIERSKEQKREKEIKTLQGEQ
jgi:hypothetical protein